MQNTVGQPIQVGRLEELFVRYLPLFTTWGEEAAAGMQGIYTGTLLYCYNRSTDSWSFLGKMLTPRYDVMAAVLPTNMLVVVGGNVTNCLNPSVITEIGYMIPTGTHSRPSEADCIAEEGKRKGEQMTTLKREESFANDKSSLPPIESDLNSLEISIQSRI